jgi:hypothetical protein
MSRRAAVFALVVLIALLWRPVLRPIGAGTVVVADIYSSAVWDRNVAALVTPPPRLDDGPQTFRGIEMRVTWWIPGWGARHPSVMLVNGATELGNDDPETRRLAEALARAGYLVMLPEFPFLKAGRLERDAPAIIDAAFAHLAARAEARSRATGAFGFSVGGGMLLAAASRGGALQGARYVGAIGAYFDLDTYLASVVGSAQRRNGAMQSWDPDPEVRLRLPVAAAEAIPDLDDRMVVIDALRATGGRLPADPPTDLGDEAVSLWRALAASDYEKALDRLRELPASLRETLERLSPRASWSAIRAPVFWLHDVADRFEPIAEAETAAAAPRTAPIRFQRTALLSHAAALSEGAREGGVNFWVPELSGLLFFAVDALAAGG